MTSFTTETDKAASETAEEKEKPQELVPFSRIEGNPPVWKDALRLAQMLTFCRPHQSKTESAFIKEFLIPLGVRFDKKGNIYKRIGDAPVLWSSHTDTVHAKKGMQKVVYWVEKKSGDTFFSLDKDSKSSCLGADDTVGIWLMTEMIKAKVPGLYIFHRGEEVGGQGSKWIAENNKDVLEGIKFAIAFDRRDTESIITFQRSTRCCSDEFAKSLAGELGLGHKCDDGGMFTDTASYTDLIPECTNVSVGYFDAHCSTERINLDYLFKLRDAVRKIDLTKLVEKRKAGDNERKSYYSGGSYRGGYADYGEYDYYGDWGSDGWGTRRKEPTRFSKKADLIGPGYTYVELDALYGAADWYQWFAWDSDTLRWYRMANVKIPDDALLDGKKKDLGVVKGWKQGKRPDATPLQLKWMVQDNAEIILDLLEHIGYGPEELVDYLALAGGSIPLHLRH